MHHALPRESRRSTHLARVQGSSFSAVAAVAAAVLSLSCLCAPALAEETDDIARLIQAGRSTEALRLAEQRLQRKPEDPQLRFLRGVALAEQGRSTEALAAFNKLVQDHPELPEPYNNLAVLYANLGQFDRARNSLETAIRTNPSYATAHENLGDLYAMLASQAYSKAMQLDATNTRAAPKLALIRDLMSNKPPQAPAAPAPAVQVAKAPDTGGRAGRQINPVPLPPQPAIASPQATAPAAPSAAQSAAASPSTATQGSSTRPQPPIAVEKVAPPVAAAPATASAAAAPATASGAEADVRRAVEAWAEAWSRKDVDAYLAAYTPTHSGDSANRKAWEDNRRIRIEGKRSIQVRLSEMKVTVQGDRATATFRQSYRGDSLVAKSRKTLKLVLQGGQWRIDSESSGS